MRRILRVLLSFTRKRYHGRYEECIEQMDCSLGRTPKYTETLIENGHDYLDQMMEGIMRYSCGDYETQTLEQVFELAKIKEIQFEKTLSSITEINDKNIAFLCGHEKP